MTRVTVRPDALFAGVADGGVVVHTTTKRYYSLNETGARIWSLLESGAELDAAAAAVASEYGITAAEAAEAVGRLVSDLLEAGLVQLAEVRDEVRDDGPAAP